jgi:hypothetical protein
MNKFVIIIILIIFLFSCSTDTKSSNEPINIKNILIEKSSNRMPRESEFQVDLELKAIVSDTNLKQDIQYKWIIEYVKLDIKDDLTGDISSTGSKTSNYFFIDVDKNPLNAILSVYKEGYYKISLSASNVSDTKFYSIMVRIGDPIFPNLYVKFNLPKLKKANKTDFKGQFYIGLNNGKYKSKMNITEIKADDVLDGWYKTGMTVNPFESFYMETGTHVIDGKPQYICSINKKDIPKEVDNLVYDFQGIKEKQISSSLLVIKDINANSILTIYNNGKDKWDRGEMFLSCLAWGYDENGKDQFLYFENKLNNANRIITNYLNKKYLVKIFIGSIGIKLFNNDYYIFFGPEGIESDEFDSQKQRDIPGLPYGYLIGKLGENGTEFPIGNGYSYVYSDNIKIYSQNKDNDFSIDQSSDNGQK